MQPPERNKRFCEGYPDMDAYLMDNLGSFHRERHSVNGGALKWTGDLPHYLIFGNTDRYKPHYEEIDYYIILFRFNKTPTIRPKIRREPIRTDQVTPTLTCASGIAGRFPSIVRMTGLR